MIFYNHREEITQKQRRTKMKINNLPEYAKNHKYMVVIRVNREFWFYGAFDDRDRANEVALEIGGITFTNED